jgi:hypothetical protein
MIIANMFNELKTFKGGKSTLEEAVVDIVDKSKEVIEARAGHTSLDSRLKDMQELINNKSMDISDVYNQINQVKDETIAAIPKATVEVIRDTNKDIIVALDNKISHKEDILNIPPGGSATLVNENEFYVSKAYMSSLDSVAVTKSITFDNDTKVAYDKSIETLGSGIIAANGIAGIYELPLVAVDVLQTEEMDTAYVQNLCNIVSDYCSVWKDAANQVKYVNHLVNAFREGKEWNVNRAYVSFVLTFTEPIQLAKIQSELSTNSNSITYTVDYSNDGVNWTNVTYGGGTLIDFTLPTFQTVKYLKFGFNAFDSVQGRYIKIKNTKVHTPLYSHESSVVETLEPVIFDYYNSQIKIKTKNPTDSHRLIEHKYAITNQTDSGPEKDWFTYIPATMNLTAKMFKNSRGFRVVKDVIKNNYRFDIRSQTYIDLKTQSASPASSVNGSFGSCTISKGDTSYSENNAWMPGTQIIMFVEAIVKGQTYRVPLTMSNINNIITTTIGGIEFKVTIRLLDTRVVKVSIVPALESEGAKMVADSIKVTFVSPRNMYNNKSYWDRTDSNAPMTEYTYLASGHPYVIKRVDSLYQVGHTYDFFWFWGFRTDWSPYNNSEVGATCSIISRDMYSGTLTNSVAVGNMYVNTVERKNCEMPVTVYLGTGGETVLQPIIQNDISNVQTLNINPLFINDDKYIAKQYIADAKLTAIIPQQTVSQIDNITYAVSFDGYNYFTYNPDTTKWIPFTEDNGMTSAVITTLNDTQFSAIRNGSEWLYIKATIKGLDSTISNITLNFETDKFISIKEYEIFDKGMSKAVIESMSPGSLQTSIFKVSPVLYIASVAKADYNAFRYQITGYDISDYKDVKWQEIDNNKVKEYLLGNGTLMYKNNDTITQYVKVIRNIIKNQVAVIDVIEDTKEMINVLQNAQATLLDQIEKVNQNVNVMHDTFLATGSVPAELPNVVLPSVQEYITPVLAPQDVYTIDNVSALRGVQVWEDKQNFIGFSDKLVYENGNKDTYSSSLISIGDDGAKLAVDYDKDNPYLCPENIVQKPSNVLIKYPMFDLSLTRAADSGGDIATIIDSTIWSQDFTYAGTYRMDLGYTSFWNLPGENQRWVDLVFDFRENVYLYNLQQMTFARYNPDHWSQSSFPNQITTISWSYDNKEYTDIAKYTNARDFMTQPINRELRYLRIRCELPYSVNKGAGWVSFSNVDIYFCPVKYVHDTEAYVYNTDAIDTTNWTNINQIKVDRFIDHNPAEMKFLLSDDPGHSQWKYWNGSQWLATPNISMATAMSIETLLSLTAVQLNQLTRGSLYVCAIMKTTDIWKTPVLRSIEILHDKYDTYNYYEMIDPHSLGMRYFINDKKLTFVNNTNGSKKLKIVIL